MAVTGRRHITSGGSDMAGFQETENMALF